MNEPETESEAQTETRLNDRMYLVGYTRFSVPIILLLVVLVLFRRTVFEMEPISKLAVALDFDRLFGRKISDPFVPMPLDPSSFLYYVPNGIFIESCFQRFQIPFWNPLNGLGEPYVGNFQTNVFSPLNLLLPSSIPFAYNIGIVAAILVAFLGSYLLARLLRLSNFAACIAACSFALCPHVLHNIELKTQICLYPCFCALFVWLAMAPSLARALITGFLCAGVLTTMHPETYFIALTVAVLFFGLPVSLQEGRKAAGPTEYCSFVALAGVLAICLSLPLLIPLVECFQNALVYKDSFVAWNNYPWTEFVRSIGNPLPGGTYIGIVGGALLMLGVASCWVRRKNLLIGFAVTFILGTWVPPFDLVLSTGPWNKIPANYYMPALLVIMAMIVGAGFDSLTNSPRRREWCLLGVGSLAVICIAVDGMRMGTGNWPELSAVRGSQFFLGLILVLGLTIVSKMFFPAKDKSRWILVLPLSFNLLSLGPALVNEMPRMPVFDYPKNELTAELNKLAGRVVTIGDRLLVPNVNLAYGIPTLGSFQALHPERFIDFLIELGAVPHNLVFWDVPERLNSLIDIAGVRFLTSVTTVNDTYVDYGQFEKLQCLGTGQLAPGFRLVTWEGFYDPVGAQILVKADWKIHDSTLHEYHIRYHFVDEKDEFLWSGNWEQVHGDYKSGHIYSQRTAIPVSLKLQKPGVVKIMLELRGAVRKRRLKPSGNSFRTIGQFAFLASFVNRAPATQSQDGRHFNLIFESDNGIRIYRNMRAVPEAYLVDKVVVVSDKVQSLSAITNASFDPHTTVVVERPGSLSENSRPAKALQEVPVEWVSPNEAKMKVSSQTSATLLFTQTFYPGWEAFVDGQSAKISRANFLFQAIEIQPGRHTVVFRFVPTLFIPACLAAGLAFCLGGFGLIMSFLRERQSKKA